MEIAQKIFEGTLTEYDIFALPERRRHSDWRKQTSMSYRFSAPQIAYRSINHNEKAATGVAPDRPCCGGLA
jgi:hypothetical protein